MDWIGLDDVGCKNDIRLTGWLCEAWALVGVWGSFDGGLKGVERIVSETAEEGLKEAPCCPQHPNPGEAEAEEAKLGKSVVDAVPDLGSFWVTN